MTPIKKLLWISTIAIIVLLIVGTITLINKPVPTEGDWQEALAVQSTAEFNGGAVTGIRQ